MNASMIAAAFVASAIQSAPERPLEFALGSVEGLLAACTYTDENQAEVEYHFGTCVGFIRGVRVAFETLAPQGESFVCPPDGATVNGDLRDAVVAELRSPAHASTDLSTPAVVNALRRLYPCPEPRPGGLR